MRRFIIGCAGLIFILSRLAECLDNGLAITPPMGYNTWNAFHEEIDEQMVRESAEILISSGLAAAGYTYFNLDGTKRARPNGLMRCASLGFFTHSIYGHWVAPTAKSKITSKKSSPVPKIGCGLTDMQMAGTRRPEEQRALWMSTPQGFRPG